MRRIRRLLLFGLLLSGALVAAPSAHAGSYVVNTCRTTEPTGWSPIKEILGGLDTMWMCPSDSNAEWDGLFAYSMGPASGSWWVADRAAAGWRFDAPAGKRIIRLTGSTRLDSSRGWLTAEVWNPVTGETLGWPTPRAGMTDPFSMSSLSAAAVAIGLRCKQSSGCMTGPGVTPGMAEQSWMLRNLRVHIGDDTPPVVGLAHGLTDAWISSDDEPVRLDVRDDTGVWVAEARVGDEPVGRAATPCYVPTQNTELVPCAYDNQEVSGFIDVSRLRDGEHALTLEAQDVSGNVTKFTKAFRVDRTAPPAPQRLTLEGGAGWRSVNRFDVSWAAPQDQGPSGVAGADYLLCPASNAPYEEVGCVRQHANGTGIARGAVSLPSDGSWSLRLTLQDAAGNTDSGRSATLEPLRLDSQPPSGGFVAFDPRDPTRVRLETSDALSGVARVEIEARRDGERSWQSLAVGAHGDGVHSALLDDSTMHDGIYDIRARVYDNAGNERTITTLRGGQALRLTLPVRALSALQVGEPSRVRVKSSRGGRPRYKRVLAERPSARYGASVSLEGKLTDVAGNPRADQPVEVFERVQSPGRDWRYLASVRTSGTGVFSFKAVPGPARKLRFAYPGTAVTQPGVDEVELRVRAAVTIKPNRREVRNGASVLFSGRLISGPVPEAGKLMTLQALTDRGWRTFATPRARASDGFWKHRYRFTGTPSHTRYSFRVVVPAESGYPYAVGRSQITRVVVNP